MAVRNRYHHIDIWTLFGSIIGNLFIDVFVNLHINSDMGFYIYAAFFVIVFILQGHLMQMMESFNDIDWELWYISTQVLLHVLILIVSIRNDLYQGRPWGHMSQGMVTNAVLNLLFYFHMKKYRDFDSVYSKFLTHIGTDNAQPHVGKDVGYHIIMYQFKLCLVGLCFLPTLPIYNSIKWTSIIITITFNTIFVYLFYYLFMDIYQHMTKPDVGEKDGMLGEDEINNFI
tara:strand:- start:842 stop:1528 length:687 start_codon:yes stop_codon:yes gene_type:complete